MKRYIILYYFIFYKCINSLYAADFIIVGHAGGEYWAPGDSMAALYLSHKNNIAMDMNLRVSKDGELVATHHHIIDNVKLDSIDYKNLKNKRIIFENTKYFNIEQFDDNNQNYKKFEDFLEYLKYHAREQVLRIEVKSHNAKDQKIAIEKIYDYNLLNRVYIEVNSMKDLKRLKAEIKDLPYKNRVKIILWANKDKNLIYDAINAKELVGIGVLATDDIIHSKIIKKIQDAGLEISLFSSYWTYKMLDYLSNLELSRPLILYANRPDKLLRYLGITPKPIISYPKNGDRFISGSKMTLRTYIGNSNSNISQYVEFFANGKKIGEDKIAPYTYDWFPSDGNYSLFVKLTETLNGSKKSSVSETINISFSKKNLLHNSITNYYVSTIGSDNNSGKSKDNAFRTIQKAVNIALAGDVVNIVGGVYREGNIQAKHSGEKEKYITFKNYKNEKVFIKGSVEVNADWIFYKNNIWKLPSIQNDNSGLNRKIHYQQVFYNGKRLQKIGNPNYRSDADWDKHHYVPIKEYHDNPFGMSESTFYVEELNDGTFELYVWLPSGKTPNDKGMIMEVSDKRFLWHTPNYNYLKFEGLTFMHTAGQSFANNANGLQGGFGLKIGKSTIIDNCTFAYTDFIGLILHSSISEKSENLHTVVKNSKFHHNGALGIGALAGGGLIEKNEFYENSIRSFGQDWGTGAIKYNWGGWAEIRHNYIHDERGQGIWFDSCNSGKPIFIHDNYINNVGNSYGNKLRNIALRGNGIFIEYSSNAKIYNNIIANSVQRGLYLTTSWDTSINNNLIVGSKLSQIAISAHKVQGGDTNYVQNNIIENNILYNKSKKNKFYINKDISIFNLTQFKDNNIIKNNIIFNDNHQYLYQFEGTPFSIKNNIEGNRSMLLFNKEKNKSINKWSIPLNSIIIQKGINLDFLGKDEYLF